MTKYIAHIIIEADTPLKVGSNASDFLQDSPIQKDWNGLAMILGTSIAGVLRNSFIKSDYSDLVDELFGDEDSKKENSRGSMVAISNALLCINKHNEVCEELLLEKSDFLKIFDILPIREHVKINDKGVVDGSGKFDEEIVYKGTRFKFSIEMMSDSNSPEIFTKILDILNSSSFRLGGGATKGFGKFKIVDIKTTTKECSSSLNDNFEDENIYSKEEMITDLNYTTYILKIKPDDFFMFGSGFSDDEADITPVYEKIVNYNEGNLNDEQILIPASSIKGAISHRTTYHYNLQNKRFIGSDESEKLSEPIKDIFGEAKNSKEKVDGSKGKILIGDCFKEKSQTKVFDHVSIDRFTGGAIDGALFQEKTIADDGEYKIEILLENNIKEEFIKAFELALIDITTGMLPLGGATTKGHGIFTGKLLKDGEPYEKK